MSRGVKGTRARAFTFGWRLVVALAMVLAAGIYVRYFIFEEVALPEKVFKGFPHTVGDWASASGHALPDGVVDTLKVNDYLLREFRSGDKVVSLYIGYYRTHRSFAEVHTPEHCQAGGGWVLLKEQKRAVDVPDVWGGRVRFIEALYEKDNIKEVFLYWYQVNGKYVSGFFSYKINVILGSLLRHRSDAAFVRIAVPVADGDITRAFRNGESFLMASAPVIDDFLPGRGGPR